MVLISKFSQFQSDPLVDCQNRTFALGLAMDSLIIINGYSFEIDDVISFSMIFRNFAKIGENKASTQKLQLLGPEVRFCIETLTVLCDNQIQLLPTEGRVLALQ